MKSTLYALLTCFCFAVCQEEEPDYENILYGGVMRWPVSNTTVEDEDVAKAVETAIMFLEESTASILRKRNGKLLPYKVNNLQKMKLVFTWDDWQPFLQNNVPDPNSEHPVSTLLVFGYTYTFQVAWAVKGLTTSHHFVITVYPQGVHHMYAHTSPETNIFMNQNGTSDQTDKNGVSHEFISLSSQENVGSDIFLSGSCTGRTDCLGNEQSCKNDLPRNMYKQFSGESPSKHCTLRSDLLFNISVMTYNIWNFNSRPKKGNMHYVDRIKRLGMVINTYQPDIIAFQEVRFETNKGGVLGPNQVKHLADMLKQYQFVYQPAQLQPTSLKQGRTEEGLAVFSRFPISAHHYLKLFRNHSNSADRHQRLCQHVEIKLPQNKKVHLFNTHLSLSHEAREQSVIQMWDYMNTFDGAAILTGDFNGEPQEDAIKFIYNKTSLIDAWLHIHGSTKSGFTYSTIDKKFTKRIDYMFLKKQKNIHILDAEILDDGSKGEKAASDHVPLVSIFGFSKQEM